MTDALFERVRELLVAHPAVDEVTLCGSRGRGDATEWSDWDVCISTSDFDGLAPDLTELVAPLDPIVTLFDPLAEHYGFMLILPGPRKVDLIFGDVPRETDPPHTVDASTLPRIDSHFWDWSLWLTSKIAHGKSDLVTSELERLAWFILGPMGDRSVPSDLGVAVDTYHRLLAEQEGRFGLEVDRRLASEVEPVVRRVLEEF